MNSYLVYRGTFYLLMVVATVTLTNEAGDSPTAKLYPLAVACAAALAFCTVDRVPRWGLPRHLANLAALATMGVLYFEYKFDDSQMIRSLGHWLVYLQLIKFFLPKTAVDDWFLIALALMQVLIGAVISQSEQIGTWLILWGMLAIWVLSQFFLQREAQRLLPSMAGKEFVELRKWSVDPYRGLYTSSYVFASLRMMVGTLAVGGIIFLVLPRQGGATRGQSAPPIGRHLTGFDDEVQLGQLGEILENDTVVMTVELSDADGNAIRPDTELLWRGVTLLHYEKGRWRRQAQRTQTVVKLPPDRSGKRRPEIRQIIKLESNDSNTLFAIRPVLKMGSPGRIEPYMNPIDGTLFRPDPPRGGAYDYIVVSDADPNAHQRDEQCPSEFRTEVLMSIPEDLKARLRKIAEPIVAGIPSNGPDAIDRRAHALEAFLRDSGQYTYSLRMAVVDPTLDPVEDFLVNRKEGHCEYFASALALLLRSIDIPSRIVNGFKGGDFSDLTQTMNVRQKHAHSWVEAYAGPEPNSEKFPIWIVLDPTPGTERQESIAHVGGIAGNFRPLTDLIRHVWVFYVVGYDGERQNRLLYAPMREMVREIQRQYRKLGDWLKKGLTFLFSFPDVSSFISIRGFAVTFIACFLLAGLAHVGIRLARLVVRWLRGPQLDTASRSAGLLFYRRMAQLLAEHELNRTPAETQSEFARRAGAFLVSRGPATETVCDVPQQVVDAFYRVRFGHLELEPAYLAELDGQLDSLEFSLKNG